jgi:hypothetical protein
VLAYADLRIRSKRHSGWKKGQYFSSTSHIIYERLTGEKVITFPYMEAHALAVKIYEFLKKELDKRKAK